MGPIPKGIDRTGMKQWQVGALQLSPTYRVEKWSLYILKGKQIGQMADFDGTWLKMF